MQEQHRMVGREVFLIVQVTNRLYQHCNKGNGSLCQI